MALFGRKKKEVAAEVEDVKVAKKATKTKVEKAEKVEKAVAETKAAENTIVKSDYSYRITEKATKLSDKNVYVLNVLHSTNKTELKKELIKKYKVTVLGINIVNTPKKAKVSRGRIGYRGGGKKAYITLKAGDSIVL